MSVELMQGVQCNSACKYCYQEPIRDAGNASPRGAYDIDLMIERGLTLGSQLTAYGGEALLFPKEDLEKIFRASFNKYGKASVQTNGDLIDDEHIDLFKKYNVGVGVSIDGPGDLNSLRISRSTGRWQEGTEKTMENLVKMRQQNIPISVIVTLHNQNGTPEMLEILKRWGLWLASIGISYVNMHSLESESALLKARYSLSDADTLSSMLDLARWLEDKPHLRWSPFTTMKDLLLGDKSNASCVWHYCDPLTTPAVQAVLADGSLTNCGRTAKDGIPWLKASQAGYERYISLYRTPQEFGGCKDCRFFLVCAGSCPGEGENQDWRLKTDHCAMLMALYEFYESLLMGRGIVPISQDPDRLKMETVLINQFCNGQRIDNFANLRKTSLTESLIDIDHGDTPHGDLHGDHTDTGNLNHGDTPHGDMHGDTTTTTTGGDIQRWKG